MSFPRDGGECEKVSLKGGKSCIKGASLMMKEIVQYLKQLDTMDCEIEQTFHPIMPCVTEMMSWSISKIKSKLQAANLHTYGLRADLVCRLHEHMDHTHTKSLGSPVQVAKEMTQEKKRRGEHL